MRLEEGSEVEEGEEKETQRKVWEDFNRSSRIYLAFKEKEAKKGMECLRRS